MKKIFICALLVCSVIFLSCKGIIEPDAGEKNIIYYSSFENESSLRGWEGISVENLRDDPSPSGGKKSLYISGGCIIPHAAYTFDPHQKDLIILVEFYGKNLSLGGQIELLIGNNVSTEISISVTDSAWTHYHSEKPLFWPVDSSLVIWLNSGGIVASAMLIDQLKIIEIQ